MANIKDMLALATVVVSLIVVTAVCGCNGTIGAPSDLEKVDEVPCTIEWEDNSDDEDGFNIYIGGSCADCDDTDEWTKVATVGANVNEYSWDESCCSVAECSCVMVRAYKGGSESANSNIIQLAPVC